MADVEDVTFDMDSAVDRVSDQLFPQRESVEEETTDIDESPTSPVNTATITPVKEAPVVGTSQTDPVAQSVDSPIPAPASFKKDLAHLWEKIPTEAQQYYLKREQDMLKGLEQYKHTAEEVQSARALSQVIQPFDQIIKAQGLNAPQAVQYLMNAHVRLTQGTPESRKAAYEELGRSLGLQVVGTETQQAQVDPVLASLQQKMAQIEQNLTARQQADYQAAQERVSKEVDAFASDPAHPHFTEVADDIVRLIQTGLSLQDAYEKAVWANPVTREQMVVARQTAELAKQKENARLTALPKAKAARTNVRSLDSRRAPTESLGTMEDTLKTTLAELKARA